LTVQETNTRLTIAQDLRRSLGDEKVLDDFPALTAYAVDASIYNLKPSAIVLAESESDLEHVLAYAISTGIPITPRAAGTNLTGSAIGEGIIVDISRMNRILNLNKDKRQVRVQPGIIYAELNKYLAHEGLMFGPDPSSGDACKIGGMLANNSSGPHSLRYGSVKDNVEHLRVLLPNKTWVELSPRKVDDPEIQSLLSEQKALHGIIENIKTHSSLIKSKRPQVSKNSSGYNVFDVIEGFEHGIIDLTKIFIGSEGTLGIISEATLKLIDKPKRTATVLLNFRSLDDVGIALPEFLSLDPTALELVDGNSLNLIGREKFSIPEDTEATILAEFAHHENDGIEDRLKKMHEVCKQLTLCGPPEIAKEPIAQQNLWAVRKAIFPTLYKYSETQKPINFVDDVVVRAARIPELIRYLEGYFAAQNIPVAIFGHIGDGNAHVTPLLNLNDKNDMEGMVKAHKEIHEIVIKEFEGSICGEHGDGRIRAEMLRPMYGDQLYSIFEMIKTSIDPQGILNPGVKIATTPFQENIDYDRLAKSCATCGKCNAVCPAYELSGSEDMSARGWFHILTAENYSYDNAERVVEACLNCKACRSVCPAGVDVSSLILEKRVEHPNWLAGVAVALQSRSWIFNPLVKFLGKTQPLWDRPLPRAVIEKIAAPIFRMLASTAEFPRDMKLPRFAANLLRERYQNLTTNNSDNTSVAYFHGCAANYFQDGVGDAVIAILKKQGLEPALPPQRCSGTPIETYGYLDQVKENALFNIDSLQDYDTIVTGCASCTLMLKDYETLFTDTKHQDQAKQLKSRVKHISEFLLEQPNTLTPNTHVSKTITYHSSCHLRAAGVTKAPRVLLSSIPGSELVEMEDAERCAGGAGTYIVKNYKGSQKIFERKRKAIKQSGADIVATSCPACMIQLNNGLQGETEVKHVAQIMAEAYGIEDKKC